MKTVFGRNLKYLREKRGLEQMELAQLLGRKSSSSISEWEKGTYTPKSGVLSDIASIFRVNLHDLMNEDLTIPSNLKEIPPQGVKIPLYGRIPCGSPIPVEEDLEGYLYRSSDGVPGGELLGLRVKGDSMYPTIPDGAYVVVRRQSTAENGELVVVCINGDNYATLKRFKKQGNTIILMPDNQQHDPIVVTEDNSITIIGKVVSYEVRF
ncbi:LexA family protein [Planococcus sp. SE5232]|uniref:LexA family protein n=1 Tax=unclassified Planococcus (in: firmicutes) TaxID=2662419 RepID=UPI003D6ABC4C